MKFLADAGQWMKGAAYFAVFYFTIDVALWLLAWHMRIRSFPPDVGAMLGKTHLTVLCAAAMFYGLYRSSNFHPVSRKGYRDWLRTTPWHPGMKLPLGPATLACRDAIVIAVFLALAHWHAHVSILPVGLAFGYAFLIGSMSALASSYRWGAFWIFFGLALVTCWIETPPIAAAMLCVVLTYAQFALVQSLRRFPWERKPAAVDWTMRQGVLDMIPAGTGPLIKTRTALAGPALLGVWLWCILSLAEVRFPPNFAGALQGGITMAAVTSFALLLRWWAYCGTYRPPLTLLGRIVTGRLIIPGYDYVMLAPATALPLSALLPFGLAMIGLPWPVILSITAAASVAVVLIAPPSMAVWQLTGTHRAVGTAATRRGVRKG